MSYKSEQLVEICEKAIKENIVIFSIKNLAAHIGVSRQTLYDHLNAIGKMDTIKELLMLNRYKVNSKAKSNLLEMDNASAQIAMVKLTGDKKEVDRLNGVVSNSDEKGKDQEIKITFISGESLENEKK